MKASLVIDNLLDFVGAAITDAEVHGLDSLGDLLVDKSSAVQLELSVDEVDQLLLVVAPIAPMLPIKNIQEIVTLVTAAADAVRRREQFSLTLNQFQVQAREDSILVEFRTPQ